MPCGRPRSPASPGQQLLTLWSRTMILDSDRSVSYDTHMSDTITQAEYRAFQQAYDFFNATLFDHSLPNVLVTLQRHARAYGYFSPERFVGRTQRREAAHELALNPDHFGRS